MFDKLEKRIIIDYTVNVESDLHIGSHDSTAPGEVDNAVLKNADDFPIVPGSSLKGVFRSEVERLLNAVTSDRNAVINLTSKLFGGYITDSEGKQESYASSIKIRDAVADTLKTSIRDGVQIDPATRKAKTGRKYDLEVVPRGVHFRGQMVVENPKIEEYEYAKLGALLSTLRFFNATNRSLGGATSRGFGEVCIIFERMQEFTFQHYLSGDTEGLDMDRNEEDLIGDWKNVVENIIDG